MYIKYISSVDKKFPGRFEAAQKVAVKVSRAIIRSCI